MDGRGEAIAKRHPVALYFRFDIKLQRPFKVREWLPTTADDGLKVPMGNKDARIFVPPDLCDADDPEAIPHNTIVNAQGIRLLVEWGEPDPTVATAFEQYDPNPIPEGELAAFLKDLNEAVQLAANRFLAFVRHEMGQWEIEDIAPCSGGTFFQQASAQWSGDGQTWRRLRGEGTDYVTAFLGITSSLRRRDWERAQRYMVSDRESDVTRVLAGQGRRLCFEGSFREAVLEAAICIEREAGLLAKSYVARRNLPAKAVVGKEARTTQLVTVWLPLARPQTDAAQVEAARKVLELRNNILHGAQRAVGAAAEADIKATLRLAMELCGEREQGSGDDEAQ